MPVTLGSQFSASLLYVVLFGHLYFPSMLYIRCCNAFLALSQLCMASQLFVLSFHSLSNVAIVNLLVLLLQNALRAVVEFHSESAKLPKVKILICKGREDVIIKVILVAKLHRIL